MENSLLDQVGHAKAASDIANDRVFNTQFCQALLASPDGKIDKEAAEGGSLYILRRLRERGTVRQLLDFKPITDGELTKLPDSELPVIWGTMQNDSKGAVSLAMNDTASQETFWRDSFVMHFFVISTPEYYKNTFELQGHPQDTVKQLTEDMFLDIEEEEDRRWWTGVDDTVGTLNVATSGSGMIQNFYYGDFTRETHANALYILGERKMPHGVCVVNERFMANFQTMDRTEIGGDLSQEFFLKGGEAVPSGVFGGKRHLFVSKNQYVPNNVMYQFATADYLGLAREYQKPTLYMEKKKRTLFFSMEEIITIGLINTAAVIRGEFSNIPASST
jgi:hypothetical protein